MQEKRIQFYDSMRKDGFDYLKALFQYVKDEWAKHNTGEFPNENEWRLIRNENETPAQHNGYDCGVFTCMFADFIAMGRELTFNQSHISQYREHMVLSILNGFVPIDDYIETNETDSSHWV